MECLPALLQKMKSTTMLGRAVSENQIRPGLADQSWNSLRMSSRLSFMPNSFKPMKNRLSAPQPSHSAQAFTLMELLIVIAIVAILAGVATPVSMQVLKKARETKCRQQMSALVLAVKNYKLEYGHIPIRIQGGNAAPGPVTTDHFWESNITTGGHFVDSFFRCMAGGNRYHFRNPRRSRFWHPRTVETKKSGLFIDNDRYHYYDPWGNPFWIFFDGDFDGTITPLLHSPTNHEFAVLSRGEDGILNTDDDLYSWK